MLPDLKYAATRAFSVATKSFLVLANFNPAGAVETLTMT
jgi:hypothetical protein